MKPKDVVLYFLVCFVDGVCIFLGSVLGNSMGKAGLFAGAVGGGIIGVAAALALAVRFGLVERESFRAAFLGGAMGLVIAAPIAVKNLDGPLIPIASVGLVGAGVFIGRGLHRKRAT